ncbi:MAG: hypothetical protein QOD10_2324 [Mycobacterium sp.]|nr:hypothetical protein [Mycobacterium sp.]
MTGMFVEPQAVAGAAADVASIGSQIGEARAAAAGSTTSLVAAAEDEVSAATAALFGAYGQQYQGLLQQAGAFHEQFVAALAGAQTAYLEAEKAAASLLGLGATASPMAGGDPPLPTLQGTITGLVMGGSGLPIPPPSYVNAVLNWVNFNGTNTVLPSNAQPLPTPEGLYPLTGVKSLPLNTSVVQGIGLLDNAITATLAANPTGSVSVLGYSQSAIISSFVMQSLLNGTFPGTAPPTSQLAFTLLGDPMNPNGGVLERFVGLQLPSLGINFYGATPPNTPYGTSIYTLQYDGYADFPRYPIDFLADLNAVAGIQFVHGTYPDINPSALPPGDHIIELPGSATLPGGTGATNYYIITQPNLPLLDPVRAIPVFGNPIADLLQPNLTYLVNWGYGDPNFGYSTSPANVPTPFGVLPPLSDTAALGPLLVSGTGQGFANFVSDVNFEAPVIAHNLSLASLGSTTLSGGSSLLSGLLSTQVTPTSIVEGLMSANTAIAHGISNAGAQAYAVLLPTADIANALVFSVPAYDAGLFLTGIQQAMGGDVTGGLVYAFGAPLAADTGLVALAGGLELNVIMNAVEGLA